MVFAFSFLVARRLQQPLSGVDREIEFLCTHDIVTLHRWASRENAGPISDDKMLDGYGRRDWLIPRDCELVQRKEEGMKVCLRTMKKEDNTTTVPCSDTATVRGNYGCHASPPVSLLTEGDSTNDYAIQHLS